MLHVVKIFNHSLMSLIEWTINPKTEKIEYINSTMELMGYEAWSSFRHRKTVWGQSAVGWLPLYISKEHFQRALPLIEARLSNLAKYFVGKEYVKSLSHGGDTDTGPWQRGYSSSKVVRGIATTRPPCKFFAQGKCSRGLNCQFDHPTSGKGKKQELTGEVASAFDPLIVLEVIPRLMNTMTLMLIDDGVEEVEEAVRGYCLLHRLFIALVEQYPVLKTEIKRRLAAFIRDPASRMKEGR